ncbi:hypothetical protein Acr_03g0014340 [Actinidia rufa]|uniref:Retrovirus-related Pol polyprotein from transposon TNT 1-94-like beta-barrel domain-containing protein n=1 Tax=Actinidia rufa TaxID=165716 RepID=A0A7J0EE64_9ERIC|nr:hypothetical protein Acr_03g0014340 [Actinidia rufa]
MAVDEDKIDVPQAASEDGKSDWVLDSGSAYHLCRDREVFSTYATCNRRVWMSNNTASRVVGKGSVRFCMAYGRSVTLTERGVFRQGELLSDMGPVVLARRVDKESSHCTEVRKASTGILGGSVMVPGGSVAVQEHKEMLWNMYESMARHECCNQCRMSREKLKGRRPSCFEKLYSEGHAAAKMSLFRSRFDQWQ